MKKWLICLLVVVMLMSTVMFVACNNNPPEPQQPVETKVTVKITDDGNCFQKISFSIDKGTVLDASLYQNIVRINNGSKMVYFLGEWTTSTGEKFDFSQPINEDVTISPQKVQLYFEKDNYPYITMYANEELKDNANMKTVVLPIKSPVTGNSMPNSTLVGSQASDSIFDGFNYIEVAVIPEEIHNVQGALFYNCMSLKEVYFPGYGYYMGRTVTSDFLLGCSALEHIYFSDEDAMQDFATMLIDAIADAQKEGQDTSNLERLTDLLAVKTAPYMYWDADNQQG